VEAVHVTVMDVFVAPALARFVGAEGDVLSLVDVLPVFAGCDSDVACVGDVWAGLLDFEEDGVAPVVDVPAGVAGGEEGVVAFVDVVAGVGCGGDVVSLVEAGHAAVTTVIGTRDE
jgi:hypothetical protein